ncbi:3624_t:CDS:1, partial [Rhizophagus irregularis]
FFDKNFSKEILTLRTNTTLFSQPTIKDGSANDFQNPQYCGFWG